ncbi:hypothetical protein MMC22_009821 [Lobaria immixta]|nr:hypothetical protein [Lobaria immixta]
MISGLPSILIESASEDAPVLPANSLKRHGGRHLWRGFGNIFSLVHLYWDLLSHIPIDLYLSILFTKRADPQESISWDDQLDLHSTLPLLIVSTKGSSDIRLYNIETSEYIWTSCIEMPKCTKDGQTVAKSSITCLKFSNGNHLAVGLSDGTVHVIEQDFTTMIESPPTPEIAQQPNSERVTLLPLGGSNGVNAGLAGRVTNLVFSPSIGGMPGDDVWLAIATEKAGIWIWSQRRSEAIRAVSTAGINEGCLHWVSVLGEHKPKSASRKQEPITKWRRRSGFGEGVDDASLVDSYFAPSPGRAEFPTDRKWTAPPHAHNSKPIGSSIGVFRGPSPDAEKNTHSGGSFLVFGTKDGRLRIQHLWHGSRTMVRGTSIELYPSAFAQSHRELIHRFGPAGGEITHLVMQSPDITTSEAKLTIFVASKNDADSSIPIHKFSVSVPFKAPLETWCGWVPALAAEILRSLVNCFLAGGDCRWLSRQIWSSEGEHRLVRYTALRASTASADHQQNTALASASALAHTPFVLTTTHVKQPGRFNRTTKDKCILRTLNASDFSLADQVTINPLVPMPDDLTPPPPPPPQEPPTPGRNYFTAMSAQGGSTESTRKQRRRHGGPATHAYDCGRAAWGQQKRGEAVGGFFYQPASLIDASLAVGLFKVKY